MPILEILFAIIVWPCWAGFVISKLWIWFLVPKFGFPVINWAMAIGLSLIVQLAKGFQVNKSDENECWKGFVFVAGIPLVALCMGYILRQYAA